ncbi:YeiH family protein [Fictibacillus barbaricus]|uniref:YeiH family putative sulfate export transporter n=1 Tax=Fictibacillus barbaricus TaxID=182136 RepID=A0ABS2ZC32_9BACL|nr:YeiH family protein [Fictibacillus barbaricus]MBN3544181.1 YeiH family putative sulfate export transporter [Fictibacillus barbaricus]GGB69561.1 membrane protein [Fictibacillus barbaricus]
MGLAKRKIESSKLFASQSLQLEPQYPKIRGYLQGICLTAVLAFVARGLATLPYISIMGAMVISILLGMTWRGLMGVTKESNVGISFSSKVLLRIGIVLIGLRLNLSDIAAVGWKVLLINAFLITVTLIVITQLGKWFKVDPHLSVLTAVGTAVCGAAAIVAVAPLIRSKKEHTAIAVATIAIMGTIGTIIYTMLYPILSMDSYFYGLWSGSTLHELAHVIAASQVGGVKSSEIGIIVKLGRVAMLIPIALILGYLYRKEDKKENDIGGSGRLPFPWFIVGFLAMSVINTLDLVSEEMIQLTILISAFLLSMAMAGLGLSVDIKSMKKFGGKTLLICLIGSVALSLLGPLLLKLSE